MKKMICLVIALFFLPSIFAISLNVESQSSNEVMVLGISQPATFDLKITNLDATDNFEFFNLWGFNMEPQFTGEIKRDATKDVELKIYPRSDFNIRGYYTFSYSLKGRNSQFSEQELTFKIVNLEDALKIGLDNFDEDKNELTIYIQNKENFNFKDINAEFSSAFFKTEKTFDLGANEKKLFKIYLDKEEFSQLKAGFYTLEAKVTLEKLTVNLESIINFEENENLKTTEESYGWLINTKKIRKENLGNVVVNSQVTVTKNIISRLFTSLSPEPDVVERKGLRITYLWENSVNPGKTFEVKVTTNWTLPLIILILIGVIVYLVKNYSKKDVVLKKKVTFIHAKGGEFALKVSILVQAKKYIEKVNVIDRLPMLTRLYPKFGGTEPTRASEEKRRIDWNFEKLEEGEVRMLSYVIYSKVGVLGKFALPKATAIYEEQGQLKETQSNQTYFMAEALRDNESS